MTHSSISSDRKAELFVSAPLVALLDGIFQSNLTLAELRQHGDFGIGTFDGLDGEMILLEGKFYQARSNGKIRIPALDTHTPFACTTFFNRDTVDEVPGSYPWEKFEELIAQCLPSENMLYSIRVDGFFERVKVRSVPKQECPRPLVEIAREQPMFEYERTRGTLIGFHNPKFIVPVNAPGLHLHFIDEERTVGGHLLRCDVRDPIIRIQHVPSMRLGLPMSFDYLTADFGVDAGDDIHEAESDRNSSYGRGSCKNHPRGREFSRKCSATTWWIFSVRFPMSAWRRFWPNCRRGSA